jgi:hypothetical protein
VPECVWLAEKVPSRHFAVALAGASPGRATVGAFPDDEASSVVAAGAAGEAVGAADAVNEWSTPPCLEQAPCDVRAVE